MGRKNLSERDEHALAAARRRLAPSSSVQLPDRIAAELRERILSGSLRDGDFLRPDRISDELGVSPTPVREALQALRADDMVRALPRRGFVVSPLHRADLADLFTVEARLTGELAARAATRATPSDLDALRELADRVDENIRLVAHRRERDRDGAAAGELIAAEHAFHVAVNRLAGARKLAWLAGRTANYVPRTFYIRSEAWRTAAGHSHRALLDALSAHDGVGAAAAMSAHVVDGRDLLLAHLDAAGRWDVPSDGGSDGSDGSDHP